MRLLLDAHVSGPVVGQSLQTAGHDVFPIDAHPELEGLHDQELLGLAAAEHRIFVTHNVADFPSILREWSAADRSHSGIILVYGIGHNEFDLLRRGILRWLELKPNQREWVDFPAVLSRGFAGTE